MQRKHWLKSGWYGVLLALLMWALLFGIGAVRYKEQVVYCIKAPCPPFKGFVTSFQNVPLLSMGEFVQLVLLSIVSLFIAGVVIDWLYGRIKNRNTVRQ